MRRKMNVTKNNLNYYLQLPYTVVLKSEEAGGFFVEIEELPGCMSQGDTAEEALRTIQEAKQLWIETALENNIEIPIPLSKQEYSGKFIVRIPKSLHKRIVTRANKEGVSLNQMVCMLLSGRISTQEIIDEIQSAIKLEFFEMSRGYWVASEPKSNIDLSFENLNFNIQKIPHNIKWGN
jgi:antitoxin HicB